MPIEGSVQNIGEIFCLGQSKLERKNLPASLKGRGGWENCFGCRVE